MPKKFFNLLFIFCLFTTFAKAQQAEVTIQLNESFFDALLEALFKNTNPPEFPLSVQSPKSKVQSPKSSAFSFTEDSNPQSQIPNPKSACPDKIRLEREIDGTKTAVRFREGRVIAPIAFTGNYNPPLVGCVDFSGVADTTIELEFDAQKQVLIGRAKVSNVNMSGTGGIGGNWLARMVQSSIDKKINPIQILAMDKISFVVPIQNGGNLKMKANGIKYDISNGVLNVRISY